MANVPLKSIKFPGLTDTYTVPQVDNSLTQTGAAADAKVVGDAINKITNFVTPQMFGAKGDGETDDTEALQDAFDSGKFVLIPKGTYLVKTNTTDRLSVPSNRRITFDDGAILKGINENEATSSILLLNNVHDITIIGGELYGDRESNTKTAAGAGNGLQITHCTNVTIENLYIHHCFTDGCYVLDLTGGYFDNCNFANNGRMGHTITCAKNVTLHNCVASNSNRISPMRGFGLEPNYDTDIIENVIYDTCTAIADANTVGSDCFYFNLNNIATNHDPINLVYRNCTAINGGMFMGASEPSEKLIGSVLIDHFVSINAKLAIFNVGKYAYDKSCRIVIDEPLAINGNTSGASNSSGDFLYSSADDSTKTYGNITINHALMRDGGNLRKFMQLWTNVENVVVNGGEFARIVAPDKVKYIGEFPDSVLNIDTTGTYTLDVRNVNLANNTETTHTAAFRTGIAKNTECMITKTGSGTDCFQLTGCTVRGRTTGDNPFFTTETPGAFIRLKFVDTNVAYIVEISSDSDWTLT